MASTSSYGDPDAPIGGGSGLYVNQNGGTPPAQQQQQQQIHTDPELQQIHDNLQQLRQSEMMHTNASQAPQIQQMPQMGSAMNVAHHHHFHTPPRPTHSPQQMAQSVMSLEEHNPYADHDAASRKRSKVSRACDECRRKKIRCDATSENGPEACSSCKRTGARCQFSRQPMKRGPSKGYIKELADRLNSLENQIQHPQPPAPTYEFAGLDDGSLGTTQVTPQFSRKRTHSMSEQFHDTFTRPNWSGPDRDYPINGNRRISFGEMVLTGNFITNSNEGTLKAYYNTIHPTLPILPHDSSSLNRVTHCPPKLREAFFLSLESGVRSIAPKALPGIEINLTQLLHQCFESVDAAKHTVNDQDSSRQFFNELVYCQSLVLLTIASDRPGPGNVGSTAELLGQIAGCINDLGLNDAKILNNLREQDQDTFQAARRLFWVSFILDRFHASGRSKDIVLPLHSGSVSRDDFHALEEAGYHLARAADIVGQVAYIARASSVPNLDPSSPFAFTSLTATSPTSLYLNGQLARFRESIDISNLTSNSPPHLAYQYLRILVARLNAYTSSNEILALTQELLNNLSSGTITPLNHAFASLVATSLNDLSDRVETQVEAHASVKEMSDALNNGQIIHRSADNQGWDVAILDLLHQKQTPTPQTSGPEQTSPATQPNMAGLQHLAAAAVGEREGADVRPVSSGGNDTSASAQPSKVDHDLSAAMAAANEAAKAQATAAAAQQQMQSVSTNGNGGNNHDPGALVKDGITTVLS